MKGFSSGIFLLGVAILLLVISTTPIVSFVGSSVVDSNLSFLDLNDTPNSYSGQALKFVQVNPGQTGLQFTTMSGGGSGTTYASGTPGTIQVNNDTNTISLNFDGNFYTRLNLLVPWQDVNVADNITASNYLANSYLGNLFPVPDSNVADDITANRYLANSYLGNLFPVPDANILNQVRYKQDSSCDNNLVCVITGKITTALDINAGNISFTGKLSGGDFNYSLSDANGIQSCPAGQALQSVGSTTSCVSISTSGDLNWVALNNVIPWQDINIASANRWNADVNWQDISPLFPVPDANILNEVRYKQDSSCDNNTLCTLTGKITTTLDINANNIRFTGKLSGGDFNYSLTDANGTVDCGVGFTLQAVGATTTCVAVGSGGGSGRTYTSGTPATIEVNNDLNTISQNFDGNFNSRFKSKFDGNFQVAFDGNYYARNALLFPVPDANLTSLSWTKLQNYPTGCGAFLAVQVLGDTITCIALPSEANIDANALGIINGLDLNNSLSYIKTDTNCSTSADCNNLFVNRPGDTMSGDLVNSADIYSNDLNTAQDVNVGGNGNFDNNATILGRFNFTPTVDKNAVSVFNKDTGALVLTFDQNGNLLMDGNISFIGPGSNIGNAGSNLPNRFNADSFRSGATLGEPALLLNGNSWAFCVFSAGSLNNCTDSGLFFHATGVNEFVFRLAGPYIYRFFVGANSTNSWNFGTRTNNPTDTNSTLSGSMYVKSSPTDRNGNELFINYGDSSNLDWGAVGRGPRNCYGKTVLVAGTVTVNTSCVKDQNSLIFVTPQNQGTAIGAIRVGTRTVGTSFTIVSSNVLDDANVAWKIEQMT